MASEVEKFDPSKLMDGVRDRIKATFVSLIPDEAWNEMVEVEVKKFFDESEEWDNSRRRTSNFKELVRSVLHEECRRRLVEYLNSTEFDNHWINGQPTVSEAVEKIIVKNSGEILSTMFGNMFQHALYQIKSGR